ncbi:hypothetical protein [Kribbella speibonae]|uniref:Integrase n=1 Tax=Kribbella speibonae TaxID=1572660 RepID=A0A4R0IW98_9ACTN|nr:hypothetical protein [Kribbella speibonae]TCC35876.1 hypothetical protein E0H92_24570 [Kribbella speibonae]
MTERSIWFGDLAPTWSLALREACGFLAQPTHPALVDAGVVWRARTRALNGITDTAFHLATIARWATARGTERPADLTQADADDLLFALAAGTHRPHGRPVKPTSKRAYIEALRLLDELAPALTGPGGLTFFPWPGRTTINVSGDAAPVENLTAPLPWEVWSSTVAAAWSFIDRFSDDIIRAHEIARSLPERPRGPYGQRAKRVLEEHLEHGGKIPLHTGFARSPRPRGRPNKLLLAILLRINPSILNPTHHSYNQRMDELLDELATDPARTSFGGVTEATVRIELPDGTRVPWVSELGRREIEYLISVLRAACYVLIAALTGMRDSELQALAGNCVTQTDGLPALTGEQFKGERGDHARERSWWAPTPVIKAVQVLTRITLNPEKLFARSASELSAYPPTRDVRRLIEFVNADPSERPGRGPDLGLSKVPAGRHKINQLTLRRSFAVYASTHPTAELGLGIQLGHCALRMTSGYYTDGQRVAVGIYNDERRNVAREQVRRIVQGEQRAVGALRKEVDRQFNALVVSNPDQADRIVKQLGDNLHLGLMNDCVYNRLNAPRACADGPKLVNHKCIAHNCGNATWTTAHALAISAHVRRLEDFIDGDRIHPELRTEYERERRFYVELLRDLHYNQEEFGA